ncbi:DUF4360 domain-containing protein [Desulfobulbus sp. F5]|nr:DUF4360 domain-containing protein [Desulfobulbus sp. F5]
MKKIIVATLAAAFCIVTAEADAQVYFNSPIDFAGTGCKLGSYIFSGEKTDTLTVMFSAYDAANPSSNAVSGLQNTSCNFVIPVYVPQGYQVSTMTTDWRGYAEGSTELFREYFFAGAKGIGKISNPSGNYTERDDDLIYTTCSSYGEDVFLRINTSVRAIDSKSYIVVDTADFQNNVIFHLNWKKCDPILLPSIFLLLL